ncbi:helix-turn-helix domain-containing protein [Undibacter mobilis]|uniref:XRE family transcriptional regulator n=1 Tax=Undibacter mobilis TaxID=2292256 RepID=A0A371BA69_9BRAD|nr:helix-turn-helix transcriptional regulator [Undibacter mobilis]RDV04515.1 XRE family transcriptional regulator [Undibacter mobilis]
MERPKEDQAIIDLVAENVAELRRGLNLSQEALADRAEVDRTYVSQVERGLRNVTISVLARLAKALETSPDRLLVPKASPKKGQRV